MSLRLGALGRFSLLLVVPATLLVFVIAAMIYAVLFGVIWGLILIV
jgi:hypothetical protein